MTELNEPVIGYSGFEVFEECYGYNENACYIADTEASAHSFMREDACGQEYRIEPVTLSHIIDDYGCSYGEFAMEREAFARFRAAAGEAGIAYEINTIEYGPDLTLVNVENVKRRRD